MKSSTILFEADRGAEIGVSKIENIVREGIDIEILSGERAGIGVRGVPDTPPERLALSRKVLNALL